MGVGHADAARPRPRSCSNISNPGFKDFRSDASCDDPPAVPDRREVRRLPADAATRPRHAVAAAAQEDSLRPRKLGQYLLPSRTTTTRSTSTCSTTSTARARERLTIILNELNCRAREPRRGPAGDPAREPRAPQVDRVLSILKSRTRSSTISRSTPTKRLRRLRASASTSRASSPKSNTVAQAGAAPAGRAREPAALPAVHQARPSVQRLEKFADPGATAFTNLNKAAPSISKAFVALPGFSRLKEKFFTNFGQTAKRSGPRADLLEKTARPAEGARHARKAPAKTRLAVHEPA